MHAGGAYACWWEIAAETSAQLIVYTREDRVLHKVHRVKAGLMQ